MRKLLTACALLLGLGGMPTMVEAAPPAEVTDGSFRIESYHMSSDDTGFDVNASRTNYHACLNTLNIDGGKAPGQVWLKFKHDRATNSSTSTSIDGHTGRIQWSAPLDFPDDAVGTWYFDGEQTDVRIRIVNHNFLIYYTAHPAWTPMYCGFRVASQYQTWVWRYRRNAD